MDDKKHGKKALDEIRGHGADGYGHGHSELGKIEDHAHKKRHL